MPHTIAQAPAKAHRILIIPAGSLHNPLVDTKAQVRMRNKRDREFARERRSKYGQFMWNVQKLFRSDAMAHLSDVSFDIRSQYSHVSYKVRDDDDNILASGYVEADPKTDTISWVPHITAVEEHIYPLVRHAMCLKEMKERLS